MIEMSGYITQLTYDTKCFLSGASMLHSTS